MQCPCKYDEELKIIRAMVLYNFTSLCIYLHQNTYYNTFWWWFMIRWNIIRKWHKRRLFQPLVTLFYSYGLQPWPDNTRPLHRAIVFIVKRITCTLTATRQLRKTIRKYKNILHTNNAHIHISVLLLDTLMRRKEYAWLMIDIYSHWHNITDDYYILLYLLYIYIGWLTLQPHWPLPRFKR